MILRRTIVSNEVNNILPKTNIILLSPFRSFAEHYSRGVFSPQSCRWCIYTFIVPNILNIAKLARSRIYRTTISVTSCITASLQRKWRNFTFYLTISHCATILYSLLLIVWGFNSSPVTTWLTLLGGSLTHRWLIQIRFIGLKIFDSCMSVTSKDCFQENIFYKQISLLVFKIHVRTHFWIPNVRLQKSLSIYGNMTRLKSLPHLLCPVPVS